MKKIVVVGGVVVLRRDHPEPAAHTDAVEAPTAAIEVVPREPAVLARFGVPVPLPTPNGADVLADFLSSRSEETVRAYRRDLSLFAQFLGLAPGDVQGAIATLVAATEQQARLAVKNWLVKMQAEGLSAATRARRLGSLKKLVRVAREAKVIDWYLSLQPPKKEPVRDNRGPGVDVVRQMLAVCGGDVEGLRDRAIVTLLGIAGLRRSEVSWLKLRDYDRASRVLKFLRKGGKSFTFVMPAEDAKTLEAWLVASGNRTNPVSPLVYSLTCSAVGRRLSPTGVYFTVQKLAKKIGTDLHVRPHGLRHTAITTSEKKTNGNVVAMQSFSGHASVQTLMGYIDDKNEKGSEVLRLVSEEVHGPKQS